MTRSERATTIIISSVTVIILLFCFVVIIVIIVIQIIEIIKINYPLPFHLLLASYYNLNSLKLSSNSNMLLKSIVTQGYFNYFNNLL